MTDLVLSPDIERLEKALERARKRDDQPRLAALGLALAADHRLAGRVEPAYDAYMEAALACAAIGDVEGEMEAAIQLSQVALEAGNGQEAVNWSDRALVLSGPSVGKDRRRARILHNLGVAFTTLDDAGRAIECYREALRHWDDKTDKLGRRSSLIGQGELLLRAGVSGEAVGALLAALMLFDKGEEASSDERSLEAKVAELLARAMMDCGRVIDAVGPLRRAKRIWVEQGHLEELRRSSLALAEALLSLDPDKVAWSEEDSPMASGLAVAREFVDLSKESGDTESMVYAGWLVARACETRGAHEDAAEAWHRLGELTQSIGGDGAIYLQRSARMLIEAAPDKGAGFRAALRKAIAIYRKAGDERSALWCRHRIYDDLCSEEDWSQAADALENIRLLEAPEGERAIQILARRAELLMRSDRDEEAARAVRDALEIIGETPHPLAPLLHGLVSMVDV